MSLPKDWESIPITEATKIVAGQHILAEECSDEPPGTPYLTGPSDFPFGSIKVTKWVKVPKAICSEGQILLTVKGSGVGKMIIADSSYCISRQLMALESKVGPNEFLFHALSRVTGELNKHAAGTIPGISKDELQNWNIFVRPVSEQKKIAEILSTWDQAIEQNEKQIAAIREYQKGMSRAIFEKLNCEELAVTEICRPRQHKTISATDFTDSGYPVFGANGFVGFYSEYTHQNESVAVTCRGSTCGTVNFIPPKTYIIGNSMAMDDLDTSKVDLRYLYHALIARGLTDIISDSAQPQIIKSAFEVVYLKIPNLEEQMKIAKFLSKLEEMANLANKLGLQIKKQKQGLMQKLLTGNVRVKV